MWFGIDKRTLGTKFPSWLTLLAITEDANEGVFGPPPATGNFTRVTVAPGLGQLSYPPAPETQQRWDASDAAVKAIVEKTASRSTSSGGRAATATVPTRCRAAASATIPPPPPATISTSCAGIPASS